ncbi:MAG TPA: ABC transporter permease [Gemmatimonadales bacterium]|jgi:putative ABC transport system permease protein
MNHAAARLAAWIALAGPVATRPLAGQRPAIDSGALLPVAIERRFAETARLRVGDSISISAPGASTRRRGIVAAIYEPAPDPSTIMRRDFHVQFHLSDLAALLDQPDRVDRIGVVLRSGTNPAAAAAILNRTAFGYDLFPSSVIASRSSTTFIVVSRFHRAIAFISILASTIFLLCLMVLKVEERRRDVALLRFIGISRRTVFLALQLEATVIALAGSATGAVIAAVASTLVNVYYRRVFETTLIFSELTRGTVLFAMGLSVILGLGVGALSAWRLVRVAPVELWSRAV